LIRHLLRSLERVITDRDYNSDLLGATQEVAIELIVPVWKNNTVV
jgi:hypothetical protein